MTGFFRQLHSKLAPVAENVIIGEWFIFPDMEPTNLEFYVLTIPIHVVVCTRKVVLLFFKSELIPCLEKA